MVFEPLDFISKLIALIPTPRVNLTRFHGVFSTVQLLLLKEMIINIPQMKHELRVKNAEQ